MVVQTLTRLPAACRSYAGLESDACLVAGSILVTMFVVQVNPLSVSFPICVQFAEYREGGLYMLANADPP